LPLGKSEGAAKKAYPRYIKPGFEPFDAVELAHRTEEIVGRDLSRKYTDFYATGVYGGIATAYACGCCLRCLFCWVNWSRDFPEKYGQFYTPIEVFNRVRLAAKKYGTHKARISGGEPTLCREHLLEVLNLVERSWFDLFILETNGILFGSEPDYVREIARLKKVHTRVSLKAGTPKDFTRKTGAQPENFELPFRAIETLLQRNASFHIAAMSADARFMDQEEREALLLRLRSIHPRLVENLEEEIVDPYATAVKRIEYARLHISWPKR